MDIGLGIEKENELVLSINNLPNLKLSSQRMAKALKNKNVTLARPFTEAIKKTFMP